MAWPVDQGATGELISAAQWNRLQMLLADSSLSGTAASFDFTSIPAHWTHLMVVVYARSDEALATVGALKIRFNGDTAANYDSQILDGIAAAVTASEQFAATAGFAGLHPRGTSGANLFSATKVVIPNYANAANNKAADCQSSSKVGVAAGNLAKRQTAVFWRSNAAITQVTILPEASNFVAGSRATLYGMGRL